METFDIYVTQLELSSEQSSSKTSKWTFFAAFTDSNKSDEYVKSQLKAPISACTTLKNIPEHPNVYFQQYRYCVECDANFEAQLLRRAYLVEANHVMHWGFECLLPSEPSALNYVQKYQKRENQMRIIPILLPYKLDDFFKIITDYRTRRQNIELQIVESKLKLARAVDFKLQLGLVLMSICLLGHLFHITLHYQLL